MGQGSYYAVGWGVLLDGELVPEKYESALLASHERCEAAGGDAPQVRASYESEIVYLAVIVAGGPEGGGNPPTQPLYSIGASPEAQAEWRRFAAEAGITKEPQLIWISDYD